MFLNFIAVNEKVLNLNSIALIENHSEGENVTAVQCGRAFKGVCPPANAFHCVQHASLTPQQPVNLRGNQPVWRCRG